MAVFNSSGDVGFETLVAEPTNSLPAHIPKIAHYVHSKIQPQTWLDYAVVRSALEHVGVETVNIWIPNDAELPGEMWARIQRLEGVRIRRIIMPDTVWGTKVQHIEHTSDIARVKILYEEGGIYFDTDVLALKPSDGIILSNLTRSAVMSRQLMPDNAVSNAMIMAKPGSPFIWRWMLKYKDFQKEEWDHTSSQVPVEMWNDGEPDLTILDNHAWMYPMLADNRELRTDPHLATMWLGKSWFDIDDSYGIHMWKFDAGHIPRQVVVSPEVVRVIDTPLFCRMRRLFDDVDGDGFHSTSFNKNPNCTVTSVNDLKERRHRLFADYRMSSDDLDIKWVDSSGNNLHGFAPEGTLLSRNHTSGSVFRKIDSRSHAWLPVPSDWDSRAGTIRMILRLVSDAWEGRSEIGLLKIRNDYAGEILISLIREDESDTPYLRFTWLTTYLTRNQFENIDDAEWMSDRGLEMSQTDSNELAIAFDRRDTGFVGVYFDGIPVSNGTLPLIPSPKIGNEIWFNSREWKVRDTGFRGQLYQFSGYADRISAEGLARLHFAPPRPDALSSNLVGLRCIVLILLLLTVGCYLLRAKIRNRLASLGVKSVVNHLRTCFPFASWKKRSYGYIHVEEQNLSPRVKREEAST